MRDEAKAQTLPADEESSPPNRQPVWLLTHLRMAALYILLLLGVFACGFLVPSSGTTVSPSASPVASVAPSPTPGLAQTIPDWVGNTDNASIAFLLALATLFLIPIAVILVGLAALHLLGILTRDQLVIADVIDATNLSLKDEIHGLSQSVREGLCLEAIESNEPGLMLAPADSADNGLTPVTDALKGSATSPVAALLVALTALVPPIGTKIDTWLVQDSGSSPRLRFDARIAHLGTGNGTVLRSIVGRRPVLPATVSDDVSDFATEAGRWLAIQLWRWRKKIPSGSPTGPRDRKADRWPVIRLLPTRHRENEDWAHEHFVIGRELLRLAGSPKILDREALYLEAIDEFREAEEEFPGWYPPEENLANAMSYLSVVQNSTALDRGAVKQYEKAMRSLGQASSPLRKRVDKKDPYAKCRIQLERGVAQLRTLDEQQRKSAWAAFNRLHPATAFYDGRGVQALYTAACWQATHAQTRTVKKGRPYEEDIEHAADYLALALALEPNLAAWARLDPDFDEIRPIACSLADAANWMALSQSEKELLALKKLPPLEVQVDLDQLEEDLRRGKEVSPDVVRRHLERLETHLHHSQLVKLTVFNDILVQLKADVLGHKVVRPRTEDDLLELEAVLRSEAVRPNVVKDDLSELEADLDRLMQLLASNDGPPRQSRDMLLQHVKEIRQYAWKTASDWIDSRSTTPAWAHLPRWPWEPKGRTKHS